MTRLPVTRVDSTVLPVSFFDQTPLDSRFCPLESSREYWTYVDVTQWIPDSWTLSTGSRIPLSLELGFRISTSWIQFTNWRMKKLTASCFTEIIFSLKTPSEIYCWQQTMVCHQDTPRAFWVFHKGLLVISFYNKVRYNALSDWLKQRALWEYKTHEKK